MDWSSISATDFAGIMTNFSTLMPVIIAVTVPIIALRKTWDFLKGNIYSA